MLCCWLRLRTRTNYPYCPCDSLLNFALDYYGDDDREKAVALMYKGRLLAQMNDEMSAIEHNLKVGSVAELSARFKM